MGAENDKGKEKTCSDKSRTIFQMTRKKSFYANDCKQAKFYKRVIFL